MSLYRCGGGGGMLEETVLWTNPSPTSDFAAQTVTLSDSISNYDYIKFEYLMHKNYSNKSSVVYKSEDVLNWMASSQGTNYTAFGALGGRATNDQKRSLLYNRVVTEIYISSSTGFGNTTQSNQTLVPTAIIGLKYGNKRPSAAPIAIGTFTASTSAQTTVSLGFRPKYLCVRQYSSDPTTPYIVYVCDERYSTTGYQGAGSGSNLANQAYGQTSNNRIYALTDDGFILNKASTYVNCAYFAIG